MTKQIKNVYITDQAGLNQILLSIADRLDVLEGWRPALDSGYLLIDDDGGIDTTDELLTPDEVLGTTNRITITDNGDGTITISTPQDTDTNADVEFDSLILDDLTALRMVSTDANNELVSIDNLASWVAGTANQVTVTNDTDGTITLSLPQSIDTDADVEFDSVTLDDLTASRLTATDASKKIVSVANLASWIAGTVNQIVVTNDTDGTITLSLPQNIHTGATPTFAGLILAGGIIANTTRVTTTYTILVTDNVIFCDTDGGAFTATLPAGVEGQHFKIINCGSNTLTVDPDGTEELYGSGAGVASELSEGEIINIHYNATEGWF